MANCKSWRELSYTEKIELIGKLVVAVQNDEDCFSKASWLIANAEMRNVFEGVKVGMEVEEVL